VCIICLSFVERVCVHHLRIQKIGREPEGIFSSGSPGLIIKFYATSAFSVFQGEVDYAPNRLQQGLKAVLMVYFIFLYSDTFLRRSIISSTERIS
jgi:hypothetical protein